MHSVYYMLCFFAGANSEKHYMLYDYSQGEKLMLCYDLYRAEGCTLITNKMRKCKPAPFRKKNYEWIMSFSLLYS